MKAAIINKYVRLWRVGYLTNSNLTSAWLYTEIDSLKLKMLISLYALWIMTRPRRIQQSLILLKVKALKLALTVPILVTQKLIKKNDVIPIISHPKYKIIKLPPVTNITILTTKTSINKISRVTLGSYLKYAKVQIFIQKAIDRTRSAKDIERLSKQKSKPTSVEGVRQNHFPQDVQQMKLLIQTQNVAHTALAQNNVRVRVVRKKLPYNPSLLIHKNDAVTAIINNNPEKVKRPKIKLGACHLNVWSIK
eukprot:TRINITY_DN1265_c0_g1_i3.p1 TRINITY_DN1265_c0_g1~~TRINITY_DN1265_c0_g1_i3.p1  ORF type:complete len:250 (+),score=-13.91 TRINITY_DN1265_c0_g1_i3:631-1380(+)